MSIATWLARCLACVQTSLLHLLLRLYLTQHLQPSSTLMAEQTSRVNSKPLSVTDLWSKEIDHILIKLVVISTFTEFEKPVPFN